MARDIFIELKQCHFCGRPGALAWDEDLLSCKHEVCKSLAFAEVELRRRRSRGAAAKKPPRASRLA